MDVGQSKSSSVASSAKPKPHKPFARPRKKRRRTLSTRQTMIAVRPNPPHYTLNFKDPEGADLTLLNMVLSSKREISLVGLPGSGKSVILRGLAYHPSISSTFRDGVFLVQLDKGPKVSTLLEHLLEVVSQLSGNDGVTDNDNYGSDIKSTAPENIKNILLDLGNDEGMKSDLREEKKSIIIDYILLCMKDKRFLLMFDHLTRSHEQIFLCVCKLVGCAPRNRRYSFLCSTRSHDVSRTFSNGINVECQLHDPTGNMSRDILCSHAGFERSQFDDACQRDGKAILSVLRKCSGLALALAVAGGAVKRLLESTKPEQVKCMIWNHYEAYLCNSFDQFGQISGLFNSLSSVVRSVPGDKDWKTPLSVWEAVCSLGSIQSSGVWVPYPVLQRLWSIKKRDDVISVVRPLSRCCLVQRERRGPSVGILVPNVILDYCKYESREKSMTRKAHIRLLNSYIVQMTYLASLGGIAEYPEEKAYLKENLNHHLNGAMENAVKDGEYESNRTIVNESFHIIRQHMFSSQELGSLAGGNIHIDLQQQIRSQLQTAVGANGVIPKTRCIVSADPVAGNTVTAAPATGIGGNIYVLEE